MPAFAPIIGNKPTVLVLGSMPGQASLDDQEYYAHPRNTFWWIMSELCEFDLDIDYEARCSALKAYGVSVWDVLHDCARPGSLDSAIIRDTERANDFEFFFQTNTTINRLIFNGAAAHTIFKRHHKGLLERLVERNPDFKWACCPSTSPAHASVSRYDKLTAWQTAIN